MSAAHYPLWQIAYFAGRGDVKTTTIEAPTAADALTMFRAERMARAAQESYAGPLVGDVASIRVMPPTTKGGSS